MRRNATTGGARSRMLPAGGAVAAALVLAAVAAAPATQGPAAPTAAVAYTLADGAKTTPALRARFSDEQLATLELLNRADAARLPSVDTLVVPETWHADENAYSPFPRRYDAWQYDAPKLVIVDQAAQAFAGYERGALVRWGPISSGRRALPTPAGLFHLNWRSRGRHSTVDPDWYMPWYFNFHNDRGLSFHEYVLPGRPASHACVRLLERHARWLFDWGRVWTLDERGWNVLEPGTPVLILNCYDFDQPPPWRSLAWLGRGIELPASPELTVRACRGG